VNEVVSADEEVVGVVDDKSSGEVYDEVVGAVDVNVSGVVVNEVVGAVMAKRQVKVWVPLMAMCHCERSCGCR
jgi:hypothetical protein